MMIINNGNGCYLASLVDSLLALCSTSYCLTQKLWGILSTFSANTFLIFLQAAIVVAFNFYAVIVIFPAMIAIDKCRRKAAKYDMFCCLGRYV